MIVKSSNGKVYGAQLNAKERKALEIEVDKALRQKEAELLAETDAQILYILYKTFGFGPKRLRKYYDSFIEIITTLREDYQLNEADQQWYATEELKKIGVDIAEWHKELDK